VKNETFYKFKFLLLKEFKIITLFFLVIYYLYFSIFIKSF
jgi:hypothetical protein